VIKLGEQLSKTRQTQDTELGSGGADLIKVDFDPLEAAEKDFNSLLGFKTTYTVVDTQHDVTFPLLENKDGVICYEDKKGNLNFYYVNRETKTIKPLSVCTSTDENNQAFKVLKAFFANMEKNSSCRSSNDLHQLIKTIFGCELHRKGIPFEQ